MLQEWTRYGHEWGTNGGEEEEVSLLTTPHTMGSIANGIAAPLMDTQITCLSLAIRSGVVESTRTGKEQQ